MIEKKCNSNQSWNKSNQWCNNKKYQCECKKHYICEKDYVWKPATCNSENGKHLASIMDDSMINCDKNIHEKKANFNGKP